MTICVFLLLLLSVVGFFGRKHFSKSIKKTLLILTLAALLGTLVGVLEMQNSVILEGNLLRRNENGEGDYEQELEFTVEGNSDEYRYTVEIPEQTFTKEEQRNYLEAAQAEIKAEFAGKNVSLDCVRDKVVIRESYQEGRVSAEWSFGNYRIIDMEGNVIAEEIPEEGELVLAAVELYCQDIGCRDEFYFRVYPPKLNQAETLMKNIREELEEQKKADGTAYVKLPEEISGYVLNWNAVQEHLPEKILLLGLLLAGMLPLVEQSRDREKQKKRDFQMKSEYPNVVSSLALLLGCGMTLQGAWNKIAYSYEKKRHNNTNLHCFVYEEMLITSREIESGMGEERAYERFGERCKIADYRRLGSILAQNLRKGTRGIVELLETEAENAFEVRKSTAKKYGEEAGTKLLFPMMLMLGIVMMILIIPAVLAFRM